MTYNWDNIYNSILQNERFVIFTHTNMDGDAMGSASALCHAIIDMGKQCVILLEDDIPGNLMILHKHDEMYVSDVVYTDYVAIAIDCGDESRIEKRLAYFKNAKLRLCIDHHMQNGNFADYSVVDPDASATGMLVFDFLKTCNIKISKDIAEDLYVAISTDTGSFKFRNTTSDTHDVISQLYQYGIDNNRLCNAVYATIPLAQIKIECRAIENMEIFAEGRAVISYITQAEIKEFGGSYEMCDTCIDRIRCIEGVEISCMIKETNDGKYKASLRSKDFANVNSVAAFFGGGGHKMASACTLTGDLYRVIDSLKEQILKELKN